jgi:hypothetical protein
MRSASACNLSISVKPDLVLGRDPACFWVNEVEALGRYGGGSKPDRCVAVVRFCAASPEDRSRSIRERVLVVGVVVTDVNISKFPGIGTRSPAVDMVDDGVA